MVSGRKSRPSLEQVTSKPSFSPSPVTIFSARESSLPLPRLTTECSKACERVNMRSFFFLSERGADQANGKLLIPTAAAAPAAYCIHSRRLSMLPSSSRKIPFAEREAFLLLTSCPCRRRPQKYLSRSERRR